MNMIIRTLKSPQVMATVQAALHGIRGKLQNPQGAQAADEKEALQSEAACLSAEMDSLQRLHGVQLSNMEEQTHQLKAAFPEAITFKENDGGPQSDLTETLTSFSKSEPSLNQATGLGTETFPAEENLQGNFLSFSKILRPDGT